MTVDESTKSIETFRPLNKHTDLFWKSLPKTVMDEPPRNGPRAGISREMVGEPQIVNLTWLSAKSRPFKATWTNHPMPRSSCLCRVARIVTASMRCTSVSSIATARSG